LSEILDKFKELHYGLEVWQDATLLKNSLPEFNRLEKQIEDALKLPEIVKEKIKYEREHDGAWDWTNDDMADYLEELIKESQKTKEDGDIVDE